MAVRTLWKGCIFAAAALLGLQAALNAAEITLNDGRVWEGEIIRETETAVFLETIGGEIEVSREAIARIDRKPTRRQVYRMKRDRIDPDNPDQHYLLGLWARRNRLPREAEYHLNYAVGLDPDHAGARLALGYVRYEDKWMPEAEAKKAQGLRLYNGRWMTEEAAAQAEAEDRENELKREMTRRVNVLAAAIASPRTEKARYNAVRRLLAITEGAAHDAILRLTHHSSAEVRLAALRACDAQKLRRADFDFLRLALEDEDAVVRDRARKGLAARWQKSMLPDTLKALRMRKEPLKTFAAALVFKAVRESEAIDPLIDALYVAYRVRGAGDAPPVLGLDGVLRWPETQIRGGVIYDPVAGIVGAGPGVTWRPLDVDDDDGQLYLINYAALDALRAITHVDFGVNKRAWREWWLDSEPTFQLPPQTP